MKNKSLMTRKLVDINFFAINLVEDHPGYPYVEKIINDGLRGRFRLVVLDIVPFRVHWIMTKYWKFSKVEAKKVIENFIRAYPIVEYTNVPYDGILKAFELSEALNHDLYDCYYLAAAITLDCKSILTTDTDFEKLCSKLSTMEKIDILYENPVPKTILKKFSWIKD